MEFSPLENGVSGRLSRGSTSSMCPHAGGKTLHYYKKAPVGAKRRERTIEMARAKGITNARLNNPRARGNCVRSVTVAGINRTLYVMRRPLQLLLLGEPISLPVRGRNSVEERKHERVLITGETLRSSPKPVSVCRKQQYHSILVYVMPRHLRIGADRRGISLIRECSTASPTPSIS